MASGQTKTLIPGRLFWASPRKRFVKPGLLFWTGKRHIRILPTRRPSR